MVKRIITTNSACIFYSEKEFINVNIHGALTFLMQAVYIVPDSYLAEELLVLRMLDF